ncbi:MAG TPA: hypothetical protein DCE52_07885 [Rhodobacteraceae bacterium]|nr:hypothetical protein [Paracoccaceae bacterium]
MDDDMRCLVALLSDTGLGLAEGAGLLKTDLHLKNNVPFVRIQKHPRRCLKARSSERDVPLVGEAIWTVQPALQDQSESLFVFPRHNQPSTTVANSANAVVNNWLKRHAPAGWQKRS